MTEPIVWTQSQRANTLRALDIIRAVRSGPNPQRNVLSALFAVMNLVPGDLSTPDFAKAAPDIISGLTNAAAFIAEHFSEHSGVPVREVIDNVTAELRTIPVTEG